MSGFRIIDTEYTYEEVEKFIDFKYFQTLLEKKNEDPTQAPFCNTVNTFYKGVPMGIEFYIDDIKSYTKEETEEFLNMTTEERNIYFFENNKRELFDDNRIMDIVMNEDLENRTISEEEMILLLDWD